MQHLGMEKFNKTTVRENSLVESQQTKLSEVPALSLSPVKLA